MPIGGFYGTMFGAIAKKRPKSVADKENTLPPPKAPEAPLMEAYRSGRNEPHSKCGCLQNRHVGSNPTASVRHQKPHKTSCGVFIGYSWSLRQQATWMNNKNTDHRSGVFDSLREGPLAGVG